MNRPSLVLLVALGGLLACNKDKESIPDTPVDDTGDTDTPVDDTGDTTGDDTAVPCEAVVVDIEPISGDNDWFYRDPMQIRFNETVEGRIAYTALDGTGASVPLSVTYDDSGLVADIIPASGAWSASTSYNIAVDLCDSTDEYSFLTSEYGAKLTISPLELEGRAFYVDMGDATYTEPPSVGAVIGLFLSDPLIIGVVDADAYEITVIGAQGIKDEVTGDVTQDKDYSTWDFGTADFTTSPFFSALSGETSFGYGNTDIPVYNFSFEGTFNPTGTKIGGTHFRGLGDTRNMGPLLNLGNAPDATCTLLGNYGITCEACPDGNSYCLQLAGFFEDAVLVDGLTVQPVD